MIDVLVGVIHAERLVDGGALVHEPDGAARVGRDVADGQQSAETQETMLAGNRTSATLPPTSENPQENRRFILRGTDL